MNKILIIGVVIAVVVIAIIAVFIITQPKPGPGSLPPEPTEELCPNGIPKSEFVDADTLARQGTLSWFEGASMDAKAQISMTYETLENDTIKANKTMERGIFVILAITEALDYQIDHFMAITKDSDPNPCTSMVDGPTTYLLASVELILADVAAMIELQEEFQNKSACLREGMLETCLTEWDSAGAILDSISKDNFDRPISATCLNDLISQTSLAGSDIGGEQLPDSVDSYFASYSDLQRESIREDLKQSIINIRKGVWEALQIQYDEYASLGDDDLSILKKISIARIVIKYDEYFQALKAEGCA